MSAQREARAGGTLGVAAVVALPLVAGFTVMSVLLFAVDSDGEAFGPSFYAIPVLCSAITGLVVALRIRSVRWGLAAGGTAFVAYSMGVWMALAIALVVHPEWA